MLVRRLLFVIVSLCFSMQTYSRIDTVKLNKAYERLIQDTASSVFQMDFFNAFPVSFMQFCQIYVYPEPYYYVSSKHMEVFRNLTQIPPESYYKRLITLAICGKWNADAVQHLIDLIHYCTKKNPEMMLYCLSKYSRGYQLRFWQFYWSSLTAATHEFMDEYNKLRAILYPINPEQIRIMDIAFEFAWKEMDTSDVMEVYSQYYSRIDTVKLNKAYERLMQDTAVSRFQSNFFMAFPVSFVQYYQTYIDPGPNYHISIKHVKAFRNLTKIQLVSYYKRLIALTIGGRWNAGVVYDLRSIIHECTGKNPKMMLYCLSEYSRGYQLRFWQFYWSSLATTHEYLDEYNKLRIALYTQSPEQTRIMDIAFEYAWKEIDTPDVVF